jgi:pectinesterase
VSTVLVLALAAFAAGGQAKKGRTAAARPGAKAVFQVPESVKVDRDMVYAKAGGRELKLDLYQPKAPADKPLKAIVVIHGGGWRSGDKERFGPIAAWLAAHGFAAASIDYRLLPEVTFPAPIQDCKAAVRWVRANAGKYGFDPDHIGCIGGSAGAHLAAMLGTSQKRSELEGDGGNPGVSSRVQAVVAMAAPTEMSRFGQRVALPQDLVALISPVTHVDADSAPTLLLHGENDKLVPMEQSELLAEKLKKAGVHVELVKIPNAPHGFWLQPQWFEETMTRAAKFFTETLR